MEDDSKPSEKYEKIKDEIQPVIEYPTEKKEDYQEMKTIKRFYLVSEGIVAIIIAIILGFQLAYVGTSGTEQFYRFMGSPTTMMMVVIASILALVNTYLHILTAKRSSERTNYLIIRLILFIMIIVTLVNPYTLITMGQLVIVYAIASQTILKIYLATSDKPITTLLFKNSVAGSPAENEWRKYDYMSGIIAIILGIFLLQTLWLVYNFIIKRKLVIDKKRQLIVNMLDFEKEVNLTTISLEIGISLEETIYILRELEHKREVEGEFTRYGFILKKIRALKWFSSKIANKYETMLQMRKLGAKENKVRKIFDIAERERVKVKNFKQMMGFKTTISSKQIELLLPKSVVKLRKNLFTGEEILVFKKDKVFAKKEKIVNILLEHYEEFFEN